MAISIGNLLGLDKGKLWVQLKLKCKVEEVFNHKAASDHLQKRYRWWFNAGINWLNHKSNLPEYEPFEKHNCDHDNCIINGRMSAHEHQNAKL